MKFRTFFTILKKVINKHFENYQTSLAKIFSIKRNYVFKVVSVDILLW